MDSNICQLFLRGRLMLDTELHSAFRMSNIFSHLKLTIIFEISCYTRKNHRTTVRARSKDVKGKALEVEQYFEDYSIGAERITFGRTITETDIVVHAGHSGDFFPHHMDEEFCKTQPFGSRIAHGTMTFAIGVGLTATTINPHAMTYGYERLRFPRPVYAGDTIRTTVTITAKSDDPKRPEFGKVVETTETKNQKGETVMFCEHILLVKRHKALK